MKRIISWLGVAALAVTLLAGPGTAVAKDDPAKYGTKLTEAKQVFTELMTSADQKVPQKLLDNAKCIVVIPDMVKGAIGFGARWGSGVMSCRGAQGWSAPIFVSLKGGSWGLQIGAEKTDLVLFFMNEKGAHSLVTKSKFTLGGNATIAAGPLGRSGEAATDLNLNAEIYSYAKSKGLFAGISLEGASLRPNAKANQIYYGKAISPDQVLFASKAPTTVPPEAQEFLSVLPR
ncbi:MAG TPA: lipid-binding SYLF domain-containing protein [Candidatus Dormibacteraeota bacterium]|nr:lipid-binding SYLF domain-containing protein [Candidatus Dormibacteraeota bacterium]